MFTWEIETQKFAAIARYAPDWVVKQLVSHAFVADELTTLRGGAELWDVILIAHNSLWTRGGK